MGQRRGGNVGASAGPIAAGQTIDVAIGNVGSVPSGITSIVLNVTAIPTGGGTDVRVYPAPSSGSAFPNVSNLNVRAGITVPNLVLVKVNAFGR